MTNPERGRMTWDWTNVTSWDSVRMLDLHPMGGDTFAVIENGEVSLLDKATLTSLLKQLAGRETHDMD